jgi:hypothetical protein
MSVGMTPRDVRSNNWVLKFFSSRLICMLSAAGTTLSRRAALVMLRSS